MEIETLKNRSSVMNIKKQLALSGRPAFFIIILLLMSACASNGETIEVAGATIQPTAPVSPTTTAVPEIPSQTPSPIAPSPIPPAETAATSPPLFFSPAMFLDEFRNAVPQDWYSASVGVGEIESLIFVNMDPKSLEEFDDASLAMPTDFAAGALLLSPLPEDSDPDALLQGMISSLPDLEESDLEALLLGLDQVGLINLASVENATLHQAKSDFLGNKTAILLDGELDFEERLPPILRTQVWLTWTEGYFVTYYAMATEQVWPTVEEDLLKAKNSIVLP